LGIWEYRAFALNYVPLAGKEKNHLSNRRETDILYIYFLENYISSKIKNKKYFLKKPRFFLGLSAENI